MKIWAAGGVGARDLERRLMKIHPFRLFSYYSLGFGKAVMARCVLDYEYNPEGELFLDSGAFSAKNKGEVIDIEKYIEFVKTYEHMFTTYANLDVIGDAQASLENQNIMDKAGLSAIPCFHYTEPMEYLHHYVQNYKYIALGGMVASNVGVLYDWLTEVFECICDEDGMPKVKVHGFGMTTLSLMLAFPWFSVDSTSWLLQGATGGVVIPIYKKGGYVYNEIPHRVSISTMSPDITTDKHVFSQSFMKKGVLKRYVKEKGYTLKRLSEDYTIRHELNIIYYKDLQNSFPEYPTKFVKKLTTEGFGMYK